MADRPCKMHDPSAAPAIGPRNRTAHGGMMTGTMRVLLIDDDASLRRTLRAALESMRHEVAEAVSGRQALETVQNRRFDLTFLDLRLGREKGLDLLPELLRAGDPRSVGTPGLGVVVMP